MADLSSPQTYKISESVLRNADLGLARRARPGFFMHAILLPVSLFFIPLTALTLSVSVLAFSSLLAVGIYRLHLAVNFDQLYPKNRRGWKRAFRWSSLLGNFLWAAFQYALILAHPESIFVDYALITTAGLSIGAVNAFAPDRFLYRIVIPILFTPLLVAILLRGGDLASVGFALLMLPTAVYLLSLGKTLHDKYWRSLYRKELLEIRNRQLEETRDALLQASRAKGEFLANMSHEIRTPMNGILGMADLALETSLDGEQREYLETVRHSAKTLMRLLNDLLDLSKIEAGKLEIERIAFDPRLAVSRSVKPLEYLAREKGLDFALEIDEEIPARVEGDPTRLGQVLVNLVHNAIKFSEQGQIRVELRRPEKEGRIGVFFRISDEGIGIPQSKQEDIFEDFVQADGSTTRRFGGTGLGLAISRRLVELMGGTLKVESEEGQGASFSFLLPLHGVEGESAEAAPFSDRKPEARLEGDELRESGRSLSVLLAEDNPVNRKVVTIMLEKAGHRVRDVENGRLALEALSEGDYDLVLMDVQMPEMDGISATLRIRDLERGTADHVPIIALTARAMHGDREACLDAGMDGYLTKPVQRDELLATVAGLFQKSGDPAA